MRIFLKALTLSGLSLLAVPFVSYAAPGCTQDGKVCMETVTMPDGRGLELWVNSQRPGAVTISLEQDMENLAPDVGAPLEVVLEKAGRHKVVALRAVNDDETWRHSYRFHCMSGNKHAVHDESYLYGIPLALNFPAKISQGFHGRFSHSDIGNKFAVDFDVPEGTPIYAAREGTVVELEQNFSAGGPSEPLENANAVRVEHPDGTIGEYGHLRHNGAAVKVGQKVKRGELLGYSGNTGRSTGPHLHFDVHVPVDGKISRSVPIQFYTGENGPRELAEGSTYVRTGDPVLSPATAPARANSARGLASQKKQ